MKKSFAAASFLLILSLASAARADFVIAKSGKPACVIIRQADATAPERKAADELAQTLEKITGTKFQIEDATEKISGNAILIGPGAVAEKLFPEIPFADLKADEIVVRTKGNIMLLAGGRTRGTLYAVFQFLEDAVAQADDSRRHRSSRVGTQLRRTDARHRIGDEHDPVRALCMDRQPHDRGMQVNVIDDQPAISIRIERRAD